MSRATPTTRATALSSRWRPERPRPLRGPGPFVGRFGGPFGGSQSGAAACPAILGTRAEHGAPDYCGRSWLPFLVTILTRALSTSRNH